MDENKSILGLRPEAVRLESLNDSINEFGELMQRWNNRFSFTRPFPEQYLNGHLKLLADFEITFGDNDNLFERVHVRPINCSKAWPREGEFVSDLIDEDESLVFIFNVKLMQVPEVLVPSIIRFERPNYIDDIWGGTVYVSHFNAFLKVLPVFAKRKINVIDTTTVKPNQDASEMVKGCAKIMNGISDNGTPVAGYTGRRIMCEGIASRTTITLYDNDVRITVEKRPDFCVHIRDVALGPINF